MPDQPAPGGALAPVRIDDRVTPAQVSDSLDAAGYRDGVLDSDIRPLAPGMRAVGRARTVQFAPVEEDQADPYADMIGIIDGAAAGEVVVIATGRSVRTAFWGELFSAAARARGAAGVVCDGYTRDRDKVLAVGFPVFSAGLRPVDYRARMRIVGHQRPVECAGVRVCPGDVVVAGDDGVVVVPSAAEAEVLAAAQARATSESHVLAALESGATLREVWDRYGVL
jgi:4-hydroxy-4-methyl-2-oxoglutarate aldolase